MDAFFDDEPGYRIRPDEFALPDISLTADEAAVVGLATKVWQHARLAEATTEAVRKLTALGVDVDVSRPRHRRAAAERRRAVVRRVLGGHPGAARRWSSTTSAPVRPRSAPGTSSRGAWPATPVAGTSSASTPTARPSGSSGSPGSRASRARPARPAAYECPPGIDVERGGPPAGARAVHRRGSCSWSARAPGTRCAAAPTSSRPASPGPTAATRPGTGWCSTRGSMGLADEVLGFGADVVRRGARRAPPAGRGPADRGRRRRRSVSAAAAAERQGPGRPAADPGALPARPRRGAPRRGGRGARRQPRPAAQATSRCCSCAACRAATPTT